MTGPIRNNGIVTTDSPEREPAADQDPVTIGNDAVQVRIDAQRGGRIAQITFRDVDLLIDEQDSGGDTMRWGCYPMVPWAGRIRHGRFEFDGTTHQLPVSEDGHAIHGVGYTSAWEIESHDEAHLELALRLPTDASWPFGGNARQTFTVDGNEILLELAVTADDTSFPVTFGWHPWFRKPDRLEFHPVAMYRRLDGVAVDQRVDVPPGPWDDCFVSFEPVVTMVHDITVKLTSDCTDWVVYDQPSHATCIEPQSGPPDAFNIRPDTLEPGQATSRWFKIALTA